MEIKRAAAWQEAVALSKTDGNRPNAYPGSGSVAKRLMHSFAGTTKPRQDRRPNSEDAELNAAQPRSTTDGLSDDFILIDYHAEQENAVKAVF
jgi:hypothetical protein